MKIKKLRITQHALDQWRAKLRPAGTAVELDALVRAAKELGQKDPQPIRVRFKSGFRFLVDPVSVYVLDCTDENYTRLVTVRSIAQETRPVLDFAATNRSRPPVQKLTTGRRTPGKAAIRKARLRAATEPGTSPA